MDKEIDGVGLAAFETGARQNQSILAKVLVNGQTIGRSEREKTIQ